MQKVHRKNTTTERLISQSSFYEVVFTLRDKRFHYEGLTVIGKDRENTSRMFNIG